MNHDSTTEIRAILAVRGLSLKKRWGQNFLVNRGARERLVALLGIERGERVWEIGPGLGSMTEMLLAAAGGLTAFEVDRGLCRFLEEEYGSAARFHLVQGDFTETWMAVRDAEGAPDRLLGNLPYRSASLMIAGIVEGELHPRSTVFTVQRELAGRMTARPGEKSYSSFSVLCQSCFRVEHEGDLKPGSFYPVPDVVSSVIRLDPRVDAPTGPALRALSGVLRTLFAARRKTLRNNVAAAEGRRREAVQGMATKPLDPAGILAALERAAIDPGLRAEQVPPDAWVGIARDLTGP